MSLFAVNLPADQTNRGICFIETKTVNGFSIGVTDVFGRTNTPPDRHLCFTIWTTNKVWNTNRLETAVFPTQSEYAYQIELFDTNGIAVSKTELGKKVGSDFFDFDLTPSKKGIQLQRIFAARKEESAELLEIFRPSDFFKIEKPGIYLLRIHFQILAFPKTGPNDADHTNILIRFPPINYPLAKQ